MKRTLALITLAFVHLVGHVHAGVPLQDANLTGTTTVAGTATVSAATAVSGSLTSTGSVDFSAITNKSAFRTAIGLQIGADVQAFNAALAAISANTGALNLSGTTLTLPSVFPRMDGSYANPAWITSLAWSKLTATPTTLDGYGITNGLASTNNLNDVTNAGLSRHNLGMDLPGNQAVWLHASFNGSPEFLTVQASYDLQNWYILSSYVAPVRSIRDPKLLYHRGIWWCSYTESENASGLGKKFGLAQSIDLINWTSTEIDLSSQVAANHLIWQPLLIEDANGNACCVVADVTAGRYFYLEPSSQDDLTTLQYVQDVTTPWSGDQNSVVLVSGTYYLDATPGSNVHTVYTSTSMKGPWASLTTTTSHGAVGYDAMAVMYDAVTNTWYDFSNGPANGVIDYQTTSSPLVSGSTWGSEQFGQVIHLQGGPQASCTNPDPHRCTGPAAASIRHAIHQVLNQDQQLTSPSLQSLPRGVAFTTSGGGSASMDGVGLSSTAWAPLVVSNSTSGAKASACICPAVDLSIASSGQPLINISKEWEFHAQFEALGSSTSPVRLLFGVPYNHLGTLDHSGWGLEFFFGKINFISYDGGTSTLTTTTISTSTALWGALDVRVRVHAAQISVWINGALLYRTHTFPNSLTGIDQSYQGIVMEAEGIDATNALGWFLSGTVQTFP